MAAAPHLGKLGYILVVAFTLLFLSSSVPTATAAVGGARLEHRRISTSSSPSFARRSDGCTSNTECGRNAYCSKGICQSLQPDGARCASSSACFSGSCDTRKGTCQSSNLSLGSKCASSSSCKSGNCHDGYCLRKVSVGSSCYKTANCASGYCDMTTKKCSATGTGSDLKAELQPSLPLGKDASDLSNLKPQTSQALYFTHSGVFDESVSQLFATSQTDFSNPAIVLSHSSLIKQPTCTSSGVLEIPFVNQEAYNYAKTEWKAVEGDQITLVTHSDACGASSSEKTDERTYWIVKKDGMGFDDDSLTIDLSATEIGHEDAIGGMDIVFGSTNPSSPTIYTRSTLDDTSGTTTTSTSSSPLCGAPASDTINGLPAATCGTGFDKALDASGGYLDLSDVSTLGQGISQIAPGMDNNVADYEDETSYTSDDSSSSSSSSSSDNSRRRRNHRRRSGLKVHKRSADSLNKRGLFSSSVKFFKKVGSTVVSAANTYVSVAKSGIAAGLAQTPLAKLPIVAKFIEDNPFALDSKISLNLKIPEDKLSESKSWGKQFKLFTAKIPEKKEKGDKKKTGDTKSTASSKSAAARRAEKGDKGSESELTGELSLFCVDCNVTGNAVLTGRVAFKTGEQHGGLKDAYVQVNGAILASAFLGLEAEAEYKFEKKANILTVPLGGFSIRDSVVIGPAAQLDAQFKFSMNAEGTILVGGTFALPAFQARLDLLSEKAFTQSGFTPVITKKFDVKGEITAEASLGLPLTVLVGVKIKPLSFDKSVGLTTEPAIGVSGKYLFDNTVEKGAEDCNGGIEYEIGVSNDISINFLGTVKSLNKWEKKLVEPTCLRISADPGKQAGKTDGKEASGTDSTAGDERSLLSDVSWQENVARSSLPSDTPGYKSSDSSFGTFEQSTSETDEGTTAETTSGNSATKDLLAQGFQYVQMTSKDKTMVLAINEDGNFVPQDASTDDNALIMMATTTHAVVSNPAQQVFVYYPQEMTAYNASRVRAVDSTAVPKSADAVAFVPINDDANDSTDGTYIVTSTDGKSFLPVICNFGSGSTSKLFLVGANSLDSGTTALQSDSTQNTVTGDVVSGCAFFDLVSSGFGGLA